ncbi:MAG: M56 family metallopeptidase [Bacteroidaceae bacterium]|nr:M56 family metallopeptidase [Bacteroidaceae bacterium]
MASIFIYIFKWALSLTLLYSLYGLFLRKETFHRFNRMVLMGILLTSMGLPFCTIHTTKETVVSKGVTDIEESISNEIVIQYQPEEDAEGVEPNTTISFIKKPQSEREVPTRTLHLSLVRWLILLYLLGVIYFWGRYLTSISAIYRVMRKSQRIDKEGLPQGVRLKSHPSIRSPFCWFGTIIIRDEDLESNANIKEAIIAHELAHVQLRHSWDNLLADFTANMLWWLPFIWMLRRDLRDVHEYQADQAVMQMGIDAHTYQMLLIDRATEPTPYEIANNFEQNPIKRRLIMMFRNQSGRYAWMKALYLIPLAAIALAAFAKPNVMETIETKVSDEMDSFPTPFSASRSGADTPSSDENDWAQDPRGIYRLTKITGRDGIEMNAPFDQYKICEEDATYSFWVDGSNLKNIQFRLNINDTNVFDYTGRVPQEEDGHGSQIYDSNGKEFKLRWWSVYKDHALFPDHGWVVEKYERDKFSKAAEEIFSLLRDTKDFKSNDPYAGIWWVMSEKDEADLQAWKDGKGAIEPPLIMNGMVVRGHRVLRLSYMNDINMARRGLMGSVQDFSHVGKKQIRIGSRIYEPQWIHENQFYYQAENGKFQLWIRQTISKEFLYKNLLTLLHASLRQPHPLATSKFETKQTHADIPVSSSDSIYLAPNVSNAHFEGGENALMHFLQSRLHYPDPIYRKYGFEGRLLVTFVVEKDGSLQHFSVIRNGINTKETAASLHVTEEEYETFINKRKAAFEDVVINILQSMPKWQPAIHETNGKKEYVRMKYTMPFTFRLQ